MIRHRFIHLINHGKPKGSTYILQEMPVAEHQRPIRNRKQTVRFGRLEKVHSDVCGLMQTASNSGKKYMVTFVDDYSRSCAVYFMAHKSDTFAMFQEFHVKVTGESGERIGVLKTDEGGEYRSQEFAQYLRKHQIAHEVTVPDSPEMNGLAERMNRTIVEKAKCMCAHADLPKSLWAEAASTACYVYNRLPNAPLKCKSPHEVWYS